MGNDEIAGNDLEDSVVMILNDVNDEVEADLASDLFHAVPARVVGVT
jgi:hypothetical protein